MILYKASCHRALVRDPTSLLKTASPEDARTRIRSAFQMPREIMSWTHNLQMILTPCKDILQKNQRQLLIDANNPDATLHTPKHPPSIPKAN